MKKVIILLSMILVVGACTNVQTQKQGPKAIENIVQVVDREYELSNIFAGQGLTLGFDDQGRVFGYSGLNRFFGKVEIKDGKMKVSTLASTRMGGSREALIREDQYLSLLNSMTKIEEEEGKLILTNDMGEQLIFVAK